MTAPRVVGIDPSLTSTGLADSHGRTDRVRTKATDGTVIADVDRLNRIASAVASFVDLYQPDDDTYDLADLVVIEGPAYSRALGSGHHTAAGLWWLTVDRILRVDSDALVLVVPPNLRAMYATGKGTSGKDAVLASAIERLGIRGPFGSGAITGNDVADAAWLAALGARMLGHPIDDVPKTHTRALDKLALPTTA